MLPPFTEGTTYFFLIKDISRFCFIPITVGGGIRNLEDVKDALNSGADKVYINSQIVKNPKLISKVIEKYGSSTLVAGIDCKFVEPKNWKVLIESGREETGIDAKEWIVKLSEYGVGEIVITSIDKEGTKKGFDIELVKMANKFSKVPIIISGGCGNLDHILEINKINPEAIAFASVLHYEIIDVLTINNNLV